MAYGNITNAFRLKQILLGDYLCAQTEAQIGLAERLWESEFVRVNVCMYRCYGRQYPIQIPLSVYVEFIGSVTIIKNNWLPVTCRPFNMHHHLSTDRPTRHLSSFPIIPALSTYALPFHFVAISILRFIFLFQCTVLYRRSSSVESMKSCESTINKFCLSSSVPSCMFLVFSRSAWHTIISQSIHVHGITNMLLYAHYYVWIHQLNEKLCTRWHLIWWNCKQRLRWIDVAKSS